MAKMVVYKNHSGPTLFKEVSLKLDYGRQFDSSHEVVERAIQLSIIKVVPGGNYSIGDVHIRGKENLIAEVTTKPELFNYLWTEVKSMQAAVPVTTVDDMSQSSWAVDEEGVEISLDEDDAF
jgi:hypothetical protein